MKKTLLTFLTAFAIGATALAQSAADIASRYVGDLYISFEPITDNSEAIPWQAVELIKGETEGTVDFALHNFAFNGAVLGDIELKGIGITFADGKYTFAKNEPVELSFLGGAIQATASLNHETSYVQDGKIFADIDVMWTNTEPQMPIYVRFNGALPCDVTPIAQGYTGDLYISLEEPVNDSSTPLNGQKVELAKGEAKGTIDLALHNFTFNGAVLGDIELKGIEVALVDGKYIFAPNEPVELSFLGDAIQATANLNHETSYVQDGQLFADIDVMWTNTDPQMPIYVRFNGKGTETGIGQISAIPTAQQAIYTLSGLKLGTTDKNQLPKGIYVIGGQKTIVK